MNEKPKQSCFSETLDVRERLRQEGLRVTRYDSLPESQMEGPDEARVTRDRNTILDDTNIMSDSSMESMQYRPEDDFWVPDSLIKVTLFTHVILLNILFYKLLFLMFIVCGKCCAKQTPVQLDLNQFSLADAYQPEPSDRWYPLGETFLILIMTVLSTFALLTGSTIFTIGFIVVVTATAVDQIYSELSSLCERKDLKDLSNHMDKNRVGYLLHLIQVTFHVTADVLILVVGFQTLTTTYGEYLHLLHLHFLA